MLAESTAFELLSSRGIQVPPLTILNVRREPLVSGAYRADFGLRLAWGSWTRVFAVEYKGTSTPKALEGAIQQGKRFPGGSDELPMVMVPYLAPSNLDRLLDEGISGMDLSGNAVIIDSGRLLVYRTGAENRYPESRPILAVYEGRSSLVPRVLMVEPRFERVTDVRVEIERRGGTISLGTVSKVLTTLEEEMLISKRPAIELKRPETLLDRLVEGYVADPVEVRRRFPGKLDMDPSTLERLQSSATSAGVRLVGGTSGPEDPTPQSDVLPIYMDSINRFLDEFPVPESTRFPNVELRETRDDRVFFDVRSRDGFEWLSPLQRYLELASGGKREKEIASLLRESIINAVESAR